MRVFVAAALIAISVATAVRLGQRAQNWNDELELVSPLAQVEPIVIDPHTPRLTDAVVLIVIDGLGIDESHLPFLDELRARGVAEIARSSISDDLAAELRHDPVGRATRR